MRGLWPKKIRVCPRCGSIVTSGGDDGSYCGMHFPERVEPDLVEVAPTSQLPALETLREIVAYADMPGGESWEYAYGQVIEMAREGLSAEAGKR